MAKEPNKPTTTATMPSPPPDPPPPPDPDPPAAKKKGPRLYPVSELAKRTGHTLELRGHVAGLPNPRHMVVRPDALHRAAATLHGWKAHKHHTGREMALTVEHYEKALKAAAAPPRGQQRLVPHKPALSRHCPHKFPKEK